MQKPTSRIPQGIGSPPLPGLDPKKGKIMCIKVRLLDNSIAVFHLGHKASGQALFDEVCRHLNLLENDYFGLIFLDGYGNKVWLDKEKSILRQITSSQSDARFHFVIKFYTPNPCDLEEEYTRYLFALQIRRDLASGEFVCNENTAALLVSFIVQSECGDFSAEDYPDYTYLSATNFIPNQTVSFQVKVMEHHQLLVGMTPADADLALLETARRCDFYGIKLHGATDIEGTEVALSVAHLGIKVFHQLNCVSTFSWAKIRKISFKRKRLMIKLHPEAYQYYKDTIEFGFENRNECKNFWKKCVEHHAFFRCLEVAPTTKESKLFSRGSSFHYTGRTQKQLIDYVREHHKRREPFERALRSSTVGRAESNQRQIHFNLNEVPSSKPLSFCSGYASVSRATEPNQRRNGNCQPMYGQQQQVFYQPELIRAPRPKSVQHQSITDRQANTQNRPCSSDFESNGNYHARTSQPPNNMISAFNADDPMSLSLPNVLAAEELKIICQEPSGNGSGLPNKSASGDNFIEQLEITRAELYDNMSEGSYKLDDRSRADSQSDITNSSVAPDPRLCSNTRFTTKRIGNVIVKKVTPSNKTMVRQSTHRESSDDDSSGYSDCRNSSASAPASALNSTRIISASKVRAGFARFRDAIPIPIDGPEVDFPQQTIDTTQPKVVQIQTEILKRESPTNSVNANITLHTITSSATVATPSISMASNTSSVTTIIRPKVIPSSSTDIPIRKPIFIKPTEIETTPSSSKPVIIATTRPTTICSTFDSTPSTSSNKTVEQSPNSSFRTFVPPSAIISAKAKSPPTEEQYKSTTYGAQGPLPGKIITKENLVLTETGVTAKLVKPAVPPKPKGLMMKSDKPQTQEKPTNDEENRRKEEEEKLLAPLESILNDANDLSTFLSQGAQARPKQATTTEKRECPAMISVECADQPDVKRLHFLNGEVPYTLTMRNIHQTEGGASRNPVKNRKSLDLVHRNRLPSQDSFSSQDHSISPTTPDTNVVEYLLRRRSLSGERSLPRKLRTERRQTQPVQLASTRNDEQKQEEAKKEEVEKPKEADTKNDANKTELPKPLNKPGLLETDF